MNNIIILSGYFYGDDVNNFFQEVGSIDTSVTLRHIENDVVNIQIIKEHVESGELGNPSVSRDQLIAHWNTSGDNCIITYDTTNNDYWVWDNINALCEYLFDEK